MHKRKLSPVLLTVEVDLCVKLLPILMLGVMRLILSICKCRGILLDNFPFENDNLVNLLQNLFQLSVSDYTKALATLSPEHYGALPIGEARYVDYLLTLAPPTREAECPTTKYTVTLLSLYYRNEVCGKNHHLPNYEQNTGGVHTQVSYKLLSLIHISEPTD